MHFTKMVTVLLGGVTLISEGMIIFHLYVKSVYRWRILEDVESVLKQKPTGVFKHKKKYTDCKILLQNIM